MKYFLLFTCLLIQFAFAQSRLLSGLVLDSTTLEPLPSATIRILGTSKGTVTNSSGQFRIALPIGTVRIAASYLGYRSDTITVELDENQFYKIQLQPNAIQLAGVTVTDEDPAYEIIRQAIESKKKWMTQLQTFEGKAFNRLQIRTDTAIAMITEAYSTLYWSKNDSLREVITQQKQTGNLPKSISAVPIGNILNFNDDHIRLNGYRFVGPTAPEAFDYYDYKLLSTRKMDDFDVYSIELIPRSKIAPLFKGTISIAERSFSVMEVDVQPNEAMSQPFIDFRDARHRQTFRLFENKFWLPNNYRFDGTIKISVMGLAFPAFTIERDVVIYNYTINPEFADTILSMNQFTIDSSVTTYDTTFWKENDVLPLTAEQDSAYKTLDSTQTLDKKFAPKGFAASFLSASASTLEVADLWFNRVEGLHLGASTTFESVFENIDLRGGIGYGLSDKQWKYKTGITIHFGENQSSSPSSGFVTINSKKKLFSLNLDVYDKHYTFPMPTLSGNFLNSFDALLNKNDVRDYFRGIGGTIELTYSMNSAARFAFEVLSERQLSLYQTTNYSILFRKRSYAFQPSIIEGRMNSIKVTYSYSSTPVFAFAKDAFSSSGTIEHSLNALEGIFDFTKVNLKVRGKIATLKRDELVFPPAFGYQILGGTTIGNLPPQRYFELYSRSEAFAGYGMLKGLSRREFYGDRFISLTVDHNFRRVLFAPLDIQWVMESNLEMIVEANVARSWFSGKELRIPRFPSHDSGGWYTEASIGLSNIVDLFRFDVTRRFSSPSGWAYTISISDFIMGLMPQ